MALVPRLLIPLSVLAYLPLACSSTDDGAGIKTPPPPTAGTSSGGSASGGNTSGGSAGSASAGASTGGTATGGGGGGPANNGMACTTTAECPANGFFCKAMVCSCSVDKPEICGTGTDAACVNKPTDPDNCGVCGTKCDAGATCVAGKCGAKPKTLATATGCGGGARLATDGKNVYWTEKTTGKVRSVPVAGGTVVDVATGQLAPTQIAVDASGVYWVNQGTDAAASSTLVKKTLTAAAAAAPTVLVTAKGTTKLLGLAVNKGLVYYSETTNVHQVTLDAQDKVTKDIMVGIAVNYDEGKMEVSGMPVGIAANDGFVVWTTPIDRRGVESHTIVPVTNATDNKTGYGKLGKSVGALLESGDVALDATHGYWVDGSRVERGGLTTTNGIYEVVASAPDGENFTAFAVGGAKMYASSSGGRILTHSLLPPADPNNDTALPTPIARDQKDVSSVTTDAANVYWITGECVIGSLPL